MFKSVVPFSDEFHFAGDAVDDCSGAYIPLIGWLPPPPAEPSVPKIIVPEALILASK